MPGPGSRGPQTSAHTILDEADFSEDTTCKQQEDLPYDGVFSQMKMCSSYNFTSTNNTLAVWEDVVLSGENPQEKSACCKMCQNTAVGLTSDKVTAHVANNRQDKDKQCTLAFCVPANKGDASKSHVSDILLHRLSREQFLRGQGVGYEGLPETLNADQLDDPAILTSVISRYGKNYCPEEQSPEFTDQTSSKSGTEDSSRSGFSAGTTGESTPSVERPVTAGQSHQEAAGFPSRSKGPGDERRNCQGQTPQRWLTEKASSGHRFKYSPGQVHYQLPDFSRVAPKVKIPRNTTTNKPLTIAHQASFSPGSRNKSTVVQDSLGTMSRPNCVGRQQPELKRKLPEPSQQTQMEPATYTCQEALPGVKSVKCHLKLTPTTQRDPSPNPYTFQKISQGRQMCQKLKEQTDQLKTKIQEFSKRIKQDPLCHLQDIRLMTKEHTGCVPGPRSSRRREVAGLPEAGPQEVASKELRELVPKMKQKMEKGGHRRTNCGKFSSTIHEKTLRHDSPLGSEPGPSFRPDSGTGLQRKKGQDSSSDSWNSQRVCSEEPPREFHYKYDTPGQDDLNHHGGYTSAQPHFLHENKMSSSSCSTSEWICSQRVNSEPFRDEPDSSPRKHPKIFLTCNTDPTTPPNHLRFLRIPGIQSLCDRNNMEETESKILNSALDHALKTATVLRKTTDQMIKSIAEDLAKVHQWRHQLKHY